MTIDPNTTHLSNEEKTEVCNQVKEYLGALSPESFSRFLINNFPVDKTTPGGEFIIQIPDLFGNTKDFNRVVTKNAVEDMIYQRVTGKAIDPDMVVVRITPDVKGSVEATRLFLDAYEKHVNLGPDEPVLNKGYSITNQWLEWYVAKYSVTPTVAWIEGAKKLALVKGVDLTRHSFYLGDDGSQVIYFLKPECTLIR